jgi:hypothetical protein
VLPPARSPFPSASGGLRALGCVGKRWLSVRRCRLGPRCSRVWVPAARLWRWRRRRHGIKSSALPRLGDAPLRRHRRAWGLYRSWRGLLSWRLGEVAVPATRFVWSTPMRRFGCGGGGYVLERYVDLASPSVVFRRLAQIQGHDGVGCVPGRCASLVVQSLGAMVLLLVCGGQLSSRPSSGDFGGGGIRRWMAVQEDAEISTDLYAISKFCRGLCVGWWSSLYPSCMRWSLYVYLYVFLYNLI